MFDRGSGLIRSSFNGLKFGWKTKKDYNSFVSFFSLALFSGVAAPDHGSRESRCHRRRVGLVFLELERGNVDLRRTFEGKPVLRVFTLYVLPYDLS